jgi:hypothetical protein
MHGLTINASEATLVVMALLNRLTITGIATGLGHEIRAERTILLCMNALGNPNMMQMNTDRLDSAHAEVHKELRKEMANKVGGAVINPGDASGIQRLTMCEFSVNVTHKQDTTSIVYENEP